MLLAMFYFGFASNHHSASASLFETRLLGECVTYKPIDVIDVVFVSVC